MKRHTPRLTTGQTCLLSQYERGLARVARVLAEKAGRTPAEMMLLLAHERSQVGALLSDHVRMCVTPRLGAVVVPGFARELPAWIARLALAGPVVDCTLFAGVPLIVIDEQDAMALCTIGNDATSANLAAQYRSINSSE